MTEFGLARDQEALDTLLRRSAVCSRAVPRDLVVEFEEFERNLTTHQIKALAPQSEFLDDEAAARILGPDHIPGSGATLATLLGRARCEWWQLKHELRHYRRSLRFFRGQLSDALSLVVGQIRGFLHGDGVALSPRNRRMLMTAAADLGKIVPIMGIAALPGGSLLVALAARFAPASLPSSLPNGADEPERWHWYHEVDSQIASAGRRIERQGMH